MPVKLIGLMRLWGQEADDPIEETETLPEHESKETAVSYEDIAPIQIEDIPTGDSEIPIDEEMVSH